MALFRTLLAWVNRPAPAPSASSTAPKPEADHEPEGAQTYTVRIAVYDSFATLPRTFDVSSSDLVSLVDQISSRVYALCREKGGTVPFVVLRETVENLIHADFRDAVVSVMPDGNTVRISDHGPGIPDKHKAFLPGFTTATEHMRKIIKGVGSGLPIVRESVEAMGGSVSVEDNLNRGSVVTLRMAGRSDEFRMPSVDTIDSPSGAIDSKKDLTGDQSKKRQDDRKPDEGGLPESPGRSSGGCSDEELDAALSSRQKKVFLLIAEMGEIGPSTVTKELDISLSTAYRDLVTLEELNLVVSSDGGKRKLTRRGIEFLGYIFK